MPDVVGGDELLQLIFSKHELSIADVIEELGMSRATAGRRLSALEHHGTLKRIGNGRTTRYRIMADDDVSDSKGANQ